MKQHFALGLLCSAALFLVAGLSASAQHLQVIDTKFYCVPGSDAFDEVHDIIQTKDKGFAFVGKTLDSGGGIIEHCTSSTYRHFMMGRPDSLGNVQWSAGNKLWSKAHGSGTVLHLLYDDRDNTIIVTGTSGGGFEFTGGHGSDDFYAMKLDTAGNMKWGKLFGKADPETDGASICKAPNKGYFLAGMTTTGAGPGLGDLASIDSNGKQLDFHQISSSDGGLEFYSIFPSVNNSYVAFGGTGAMHLDEGTGQNCPNGNTGLGPECTTGSSTSS